MDLWAGSIQYTDRKTHVKPDWCKVALGPTNARGAYRKSWANGNVWELGWFHTIYSRVGKKQVAAELVLAAAARTRERHSEGEGSPVHTYMYDHVWWILRSTAWMLPTC